MRKKDILVRDFPEFNYFALYDSLTGFTYRFGKPGEDNHELPPEDSEFYDVAITSRCHGGCSWCYAKASPKGDNYSEICETWRKWISGKKQKPFSIAIGSIGEPTEHPDFPEFLEVVYESEVTPNYTTNGVILGTPGDPRREKILEATKEYTKGVAVSLGNKNLKRYQDRAIRSLEEIGVKISLHHIVSDPGSVRDFVRIWKEDATHKHTHVLLPLVDNFHKSQVSKEIWEMLRSEILKYGMKNIAFGAKFINYLKNESWVSLYPEETYSKNMILKDGRVIITRSSFDLRPLKIIKV